MVSVRSLVIGISFSGCVVALLVGLPRVTDPEKYYRAPGVVTNPDAGFFSSTRDVYEVSLEPDQRVFIELPTTAAQTTMTGMSFGQSERLWCTIFQVEYGADSLSAIVFANRRVANTDLCWYGPAQSVQITNGSKAQVIRVRPVLPRTPQFQTVHANICDECDEMPTFTDISDLAAVKNKGMQSIGLAGALGLVGFIAVVGVPTIVGFLYDIGHRLVPSRRGRKLREAVNRAKAGETFDTDAARAFRDVPRHEFRYKQDAKDLKAATDAVRRETEELKRKEFMAKAKADTEAYERAAAAKDYRDKLQRVKDLLKEKEQKGHDDV